jgi:hypothetical protein
MDYADGGDLSAKLKEQALTGSAFTEDIILNWFT